MPVCVKSLAHSKGLIIFIIPPCLPYFVLEVLTKKEPRKPCSDNSNAKEHPEKFDNGRKDDVFTLFPDISNDIYLEQFLLLSFRSSFSSLSSFF